MILGPRHSLLTLMAPLGRLYLHRRSLPTAKTALCVSHACNAMVLRRPEAAMVCSRGFHSYYFVLIAPGVIIGHCADLPSIAHAD
jgi:hypothetical protein